jgi:hypothetical protein
MMPMLSPVTKRSPVFVETEVFRNVKAAVESGKTPILVLGIGGSGKTTLLMALADDWGRSGGKAVFIPLYEIGRGEDLYLILRRELAESVLPSRRSEADLIVGSGRAGLRATMDFIESAPSDLLLLLDGLDAIRDPSPILQLLDLTAASARAKIVVASRDTFGRSRRTFRSVFEISGFTTEEASEFIRRSGGPTLDRSAIDFIAKTAAGSPLALTLLLKLVHEHGVPVDLDVGSPREAMINRIVNRELEKVGLEHREDYLKALTSLAILNRPVHTSEYPTRALLSLDTGRSLIVSGDSGVAIIHPLVTDALLSFAALTSESANLSLSSLEFGAEEAERDALLSDSFITLPEFSDVLSGKRNIVIGDRGAGKSAMFSRLSAPHVGQPVAKKSVVKPLPHPANLLRRLESNGRQLDSAEQFRAGWLTLVAYCLADQVKAFSSPTHARAAIYLKEVLGDESDTGWLLLKFLKGIAVRILKSSVKIKLGPVMIEPAGKPGGSGTGASSIDLRAFLKDAATSLAAAGQAALVPLDRVDEIHKYDRDLQQKAVQGLFLAESDLAQLPGIRLVIFIRSDLFKIYDIQEKNKLVSRSMSISWTKQQLLQFVIDRVLSNSCLHRLKELVSSIPDNAHDVAMAAIFPTEIEGMPAAEWLWEWMENGNGDVSPRQLILLLILAAQSPVAQEARMDRLPIFPAAALQWGMDQLSELSFKELVDDFRVAPTFLANCRAGRVRSFELAKVEPLFGKDEGSISVQVERLERLGFLERIVLQNPDGTKSSQFEVPKLFTRSWNVN